MIRRNPLAILVGAAAIVLLATPHLQAQTNPIIYWQGGNGNFTDSNYTNGAPGTPQNDLSPAPNNVVFFGGGAAAGVTGTLSGEGTLDLHRLRIGHNQAAVDGTSNAPNPDLRGNGTLTVSGGAKINITGGASGGDNAGLWVGQVRSGKLIIDGPGSSVTSNQLIVIGYAPGQPTRNGTVEVTNGGSLIATAGNIELGTSPGGATQSGMQGHLVVSGAGSLVKAATHLYIGIRTAMSSVTQSGGTIEVGNVVEVGFGGTGVTGPANQNSSFNVSGGTFTNGGNFFVGRGQSSGATVKISGTAVVNVGSRYLMGSHVATGVVTNHSGGTLNTGLDVRVGDTTTGDSTYNLSGTGIINSTTGGIVGRQGTAKFIQTGGEANFWDILSIGNRETELGPTNGLYKISGGTLEAGAMIGTTALNIAPNGTGEFRVVGDDATINLYGNVFVNNTGNGLGTLAFELESGDLLSTINVTDSATFSAGSKLVFDVSNSLPTQTTYDLLAAASISDLGLVFEGPTGWGYQIVEDEVNGGQILQATGPVIAPENADFDGDGDVDGADFLAWQRNVSKTSGATLAQGDANGDQAVDGDDLDIWKGQFGSATVAANPVPEPAAGALLLLGGASIAAWRRRRRA